MTRRIRPRRRNGQHAPPTPTPTALPRLHDGEPHGSPAGRVRALAAVAPKLHQAGQVDAAGLQPGDGVLAVALRAEQRAGRESGAGWQWDGEACAANCHQACSMRQRNNLSRVSLEAVGQRCASLHRAGAHHQCVDQLGRAQPAAAPDGVVAEGLGAVARLGCECIDA